VILEYPQLIPGMEQPYQLLPQVGQLPQILREKKEIKVIRAIKVIRGILELALQVLNRQLLQQVMVAPM
jgi:hypothetical protein